MPGTIIDFEDLFSAVTTDYHSFFLNKLNWKTNQKFKQTEIGDTDGGFGITNTYAWTEEEMLVVLLFSISFHCVHVCSLLAAYI